MITYIAEGTIEAEANSVITTIKDVNTVLSYFPYQVEREKNNITLRFSRFLIMSFKDTFEVSVTQQSSLMVTYILSSARHNKFQIFFAIKENKPNSLVHVAIEYSGEKEWIVKKYLPEITKSLIEGISKEVKRVQEVKVEVSGKETDYSKVLNKLSFISKLLMKSRLIKSEGISVSKGHMLDAIIELLADILSKHKYVYVSATSLEYSLRLLFIDGELRGIYVNDNGKEYFGDENMLNELSGDFKVNVYVVLTPQALEITKEPES